MSALFNFHSFLTVVLLVICTCTYVKIQFPTILQQKTGDLRRVMDWKNERLLPSIYDFTSAQQILSHRGENDVKFIHRLHVWFRGFFWKAARIGERLSPWVAVGCFMMGVSIIVF